MFACFVSLFDSLFFRQCLQGPPGTVTSISTAVFPQVGYNRLFMAQVLTNDVIFKVYSSSHLQIDRRKREHFIITSLCSGILKKR